MEEIKRIEAVREAALKILNYSDKTSFELRKKLMEKGFEEEYVNLVIGSLLESGIVDDSRYARIYIKSKTESGKGYMWIKNKLYQKGVESSVVEYAFEDLKYVEGEGGIESERTLCLKKALTLTGLSSCCEIDVSGELVPLEGLESSDLNERYGLKADASYKDRQKAKASIMRRLASAGFSADSVIYAVKAIEGLV